MEELDLKELTNMFWRKRIEILIIIVIFAIIGICYTCFYVKPEYQSYTTLLLKQVSEKSNKDETAVSENDTKITQTDLLLNSKLVSTYSELIKSKTIIRQVLKNLGKENSIAENYVRKNIDVKSVEDTEIIKITVKNEKSEDAAAIANEIAKVFSNKIVEIYNIDNIQVVDEAEESKIPNNVNHLKDIVIFIMIGLVIGIVYVLLKNLLDNTVKNEEEIEKEVGLIVLATIPECNFDLKKGGLK